MIADSLLLIPGLSCDSAVWQPQLDALDDEIRSIVLVEHGLDDSLPAMARAALAGAPRRFALAGHSMGGRVALEIFRQAPERVTRLALLDTGAAKLATGAAGEAERAGRMRLLDLARRQGMRAMGEAWARGMVHPDRLGDAKLMDTLHAMIERSSLEQYEAQISALLSRPDATGLLARVRVPTLVLCGLQDLWSPLQRHRELALAIEGSQLAGVPECGHMSTLERPTAVSDALRAWLNDAPQPWQVAV